MINYMQNVLGIKSVLKRATEVTEKKSVPSRFQVFCDLDSDTESDLLSKMLASIKLEGTKILPLSEYKKSQAVCLIFSEQPEKWKSENTISTFSPKNVLQDAKIKRAVWEDLKKFKNLIT
jgi:hypothetical protein